VKKTPPKRRRFSILGLSIARHNSSLLDAFSPSFCRAARRMPGGTTVSSQKEGLVNKHHFRGHPAIDDLILTVVSAGWMMANASACSASTKRHASASARSSLIVYKGLEKALKRESNQAIAHWWGIDPETVSKWRRLLGVERATEGTSRLHSEYNKEPWAALARANAHSKARDPERCRKIAEARRGKARPAHVVEAIRKIHPEKVSVRRRRSG
jgi:hypothetical protein